MDYGTVVFEPPPFDYDQDGTVEHMKFEMSHDLRVAFNTRTGFILGGSGSTLIDIMTDLYEDVTGDTWEGQGRRQGFYLDLGGGEHVVEVECQVSAGSDNQWGTGDGDPVTDATGAHPMEQIQLLDNVLQAAEIDSRPAPGDGSYPEGHRGTLSIGRYSADGPYAPLAVAPEEPQTNFDSEQESATATVDISFVDIFTLGDSTDAAKEDAR